MEKIFLPLLDYLIQVVTATAIQLFVLLGPLLILAFLLNFVARMVEKLAYKTLGRKGYLYTFGWLGTTVHELGHAMFTVLFGHKINEIVLFNADPYSNSLGHVTHSYEPGNIYHEIGNFFIGIGPIILGSLTLYIITYILFKFSINDINPTTITSESLTHLSSLKSIGYGIIVGFQHFIALVFSGNHTTWWKILLLIYLLFSIGSSITLSSPDVEGAVGGFVFFVLILLIFNLITLWIGNFALDTLSLISAYFSGFYFLMVLSIVINAIFGLSLFLVYSAKKSIRT